MYGERILSKLEKMVIVTTPLTKNVGEGASPPTFFVDPLPFKCRPEDDLATPVS